MFHLGRSPVHACAREPVNNELATNENKGTTNMKLFTRFIGAVLVLMILSPMILYAAQVSQTQYFFDKEPFVPPKIIEDLSPWVSDDGEQIIAVNLLESVTTNRYFGNIKTIGKDRPFVFYEKDCESPCTMGAPSFGYKLIGTTSSGITVLFAESSGGGTGKFRSVILLSLEKDKGLSFSASKSSLTLNRVRLIIKRLGEIPLGDRYEGDITLKGDILKIGKDQYSHTSGHFKKDNFITFKPSR